MKPLSQQYSWTSSRKRKQRIKKIIMQIAAYLLGLFIVVMLAMFLVRAFGNSCVVIDQSMSPSLKSEDKVLINKMAYRVESPKRMDVIAMKIGSSENSPTYIRRVIGVPKDKVKISDGKIYVNDKEIKTEYNDKSIEDAGAAKDGITLDEDTYFVLCDNYNGSKEDSRLDSIGTVNSDQISGRVWMVISPLSRLHIVK